MERGKGKGRMACLTPARSSEHDSSMVHKEGALWLYLTLLNFLPPILQFNRPNFIWPSASMAM